MLSRHHYSLDQGWSCSRRGDRQYLRRCILFLATIHPSLDDQLELVEEVAQQEDDVSRDVCQTRSHVGIANLVADLNYRQVVSEAEEAVGGHNERALVHGFDPSSEVRLQRQASPLPQVGKDEDGD